MNDPVDGLDEQRTEGTMTQTPLKAAGHTFELVRRRPGYNRQEVDRFLETGQQRIDQLTAENAGLRRRVEELEAAAGQPPAEEAEPGQEEATRILAHAGQQHAQDLEQARSQAAEIFVRASQKAQDLLENAEKVRAETLQGLEAQEAELIRTDESLQRFERHYRHSLEGIMAEGLAEVGTDQPS